MDESKIVDILELLLEENRDMKKGINLLVDITGKIVEETERNTHNISLLIEESKQTNQRIDRLTDTLLKTAIETDKKFSRVNESLELVVNELSRLRGDLAELNNTKVQQMENRITRIETAIFRTGA